MSKLKRGDTFIIDGIEFMVLKETKCGYKCLAENYRRMTFGNNNNWKESDIRSELNEKFLKKLVEAVGEENIIPFDRDLTSLDGLKDYGTCTDHVSILSFDEYRENRDIIENDKWICTLTPDSSKSNGDEVLLTVVAPSGYIRNGIFCDNCFGVRPVCIFDSSIFESEDE